MDTGLSILLMALCTTFAAYGAAAKTACREASKARLKSLSNGEGLRGAALLRLLERMNRLQVSLSALRSLSLLGAALLAAHLLLWQQPGSWEGVAFVAAILAFFLLGEALPGYLPPRAPEKFLLATLPLLQLVAAVFFPLSFLVSAFMKKTEEQGKSPENAITGEELMTYVEEAQSEGGIDAQESALIRSAIAFNDRQAGDILTPRVELVALEEGSSLEEAEALFGESGFSRLPIYRDTIDNIIGVVHQKDLFLARRNANATLAQLTKDVIMTTETVRISILLRLLQGHKSHMAAVVDEFGGTAGIVTLEDIVEELVGDIWDEHDEVIPDHTRMSDGSMLVSGNANLEKLFDLLGIDVENEEVTTLNGWIMQELGRIPLTGDRFDFPPYRLVVTRTEHHRVAEARLIPLTAAVLEESDLPPLSAGRV